MSTALSDAAVARGEPICDDCSAVLKPTSHAVCRKCHREAIRSAEYDAGQEAKEEAVAEGGCIREWAARRFAMGQISAAVRAELELCAEDVEVGHG